MRFSDEFIQELKQRNDILDIISGYVILKKAGRNMVGLCPFHAEHSPSFNVYPGNGSFYCFGCGVGGDVITFLKLAENLDYIEAIKFLAQRAGMTIPEIDYNDSSHKKKLLLYEINRESARFYHNILCSQYGIKALNYLRDRGLKKSSIKRFGLGYAVDSKNSLVNYLISKGYYEKDIVLANLAYKSKYGNLCDRFSGRVMFPIIDLRGNVIAFGGRALDDRKPKYLNTSDTIIFKKGLNLFSMNFAKGCSGDYIILAEGYMDVISLNQTGFNNTVATLGTAITNEQAKLISRYSNEVVISYDSDEAGQKATAKAINILRGNGLSVRVIKIPDGKDPDEYIKKCGSEGYARFKNLITKSSNDIEYKIDKIREGVDLNNSQDKIKYIADVSKILSELDNPVERDIYAGKLSQETSVQKSLVCIQIDKFRNKKNKHEESAMFKRVQKTLSKKVPKDAGFKISSIEELLLSCVINSTNHANNILLNLGAEDFVTDFNKKIYIILKKFLQEGRDLDITNVLSEGFSAEESGRISKIFNYNTLNISEEDIKEYIELLKCEKQKLCIGDISRADPKEINEYIRKLSEFKK